MAGKVLASQRLIEHFGLARYCCVGPLSHLKMASQTSDAVEIRVAKMSFIVSGTVDIDRIYSAILEVPDDEATGGRVSIHERATDTIEVPRWLSNLEAAIHIKRHTSPLESD